MKPLPWSFYLDVLCLVLVGFGLALGWLTANLGLVVYQAAIGACMTWHLGEVIRKFVIANQKSETSEEKL